MTTSCAPSVFRSCSAVGTASAAISSTTAEVPGPSDLPSVSSWSFLKPESRSFEASAPIPAPAAMPRPPDDADRAAEQRAAAGAPVLRLDELRRAVGSDVEDGDVPDLVGEGAAD